MKITADKYFDDYRLMDIRVVSTMGLTEKDVEEIKKIPGLNGVKPRVQYRQPRKHTKQRLSRARHIAAARTKYRKRKLYQPPEAYRRALARKKKMNA